MRDDDAAKDIFTETVSDNKLPKNWKQLFKVYQRDLSGPNAKFTPTSIKLFVGG